MHKVVLLGRTEIKGQETQADQTIGQQFILGLSFNASFKMQHYLASVSN